MSKNIKLSTPIERGVNQGLLLRELCDWYGMNQELFVKKIGKSRKWYTNSIKDERIPKKHQLSICRALAISEEYWTGNWKLPLQVEREVPPITINDKNDYEKKYHNLQGEMVELQAKVIRLYEEIDRLKER